MGNEDLNQDAVEARLKVDALARASADPAPGPIMEAFSDGITRICGLSVRRVVASDWMMLKALNSPIYRQLLELQKPLEIREEVPFSDEEGWEMICQFTHTPAQNRAQLAKGRDNYREWAIQETADTLKMEDAASVIAAVQSQITASHSTAQRHGSADNDSEKKT